MKLGVLTLLFESRPLEETLDYLQSLGLDAVEFGAGGYVRTGHFATDELLTNEPALRQLKNAVNERGLIISALSCHGNPLHPNAEIAKANHDDFVKTCRLAKKLDIAQINTMSGCPGSDSTALLPNWITCPFPTEDFLRPWEWQWNERVIPYWKQAAKIADENGVRVAIEMVPNTVVYNVETLLKLRDAVGETIGANLDPSHLFWQGADIGTVIRKLAGAIYHVHAKDSAIDPQVVAMNGLLDPKSLSDELNRAWIFRTVGHGHDELTWNQIVSQLRLVGYDFVLSIEHEDSLMSPDEGLRKAIGFLQRVMIREKPGVPYWAQ